MITLPQSLKLSLRKRAHALKPVVTLGQHGLTDAVQVEIDLALTHHELIKIRISSGNREEKKKIIYQILAHHGAFLIQQIGNIAAFYRPRKDNEEGK